MYTYYVFVSKLQKITLNHHAFLGGSPYMNYQHSCGSAEAQGSEEALIDQCLGSQNQSRLRSDWC